MHLCSNETLKFGKALHKPSLTSNFLNRSVTMFHGWEHRSAERHVAVFSEVAYLGLSRVKPPY